MRKIPKGRVEGFPILPFGNFPHIIPFFSLTASLKLVCSNSVLKYSFGVGKKTMQCNGVRISNCMECYRVIWSVIENWYQRLYTSLQPQNMNEIHNSQGWWWKLLFTAGSFWGLFRVDFWLLHSVSVHTFKKYTCLATEEKDWDSMYEVGMGRKFPDEWYSGFYCWSLSVF